MEEAPEKALAEDLFASREDKRAGYESFEGAGGWRYSISPEGQIEATSPSGKFIRVKKGSEAAKSILAEKETGKSLWEAETPDVSESPDPGLETPAETPDLGESPDPGLDTPTEPTEPDTSDTGLAPAEDAADTGYQKRENMLTRGVGALEEGRQALASVPREAARGVLDAAWSAVPAEKKATAARRAGRFADRAFGVAAKYFPEE